MDSRIHGITIVVGSITNSVFFVGHTLPVSLQHSETALHTAIISVCSTNWMVFRRVCKIAQSDC